MMVLVSHLQGPHEIIQALIMRFTACRRRAALHLNLSSHKNRLSVLNQPAMGQLTPRPSEVAKVSFVESP